MSIKDRIVVFFDRHGGYRQVAREVGIPSQTLYYVVSGRSKPNFDTLVKLAEMYPDFDFYDIAFGTPVLTNTEGRDMIKDAQRIEELEKELDLQRRIVAKLVGAKLS